MPKKRMVKLLNHVYEETHGLTSGELDLIASEYLVFLG